MSSNGRFGSVMIYVCYLIFDAVILYWVIGIKIKTFSNGTVLETFQKQPSCMKTECINLQLKHI